MMQAKAWKAAVLWGLSIAAVSPVITVRGSWASASLLDEGCMVIEPTAERVSEELLELPVPYKPPQATVTQSHEK